MLSSSPADFHLTTLLLTLRATTIPRLDSSPADVHATTRLLGPRPPPIEAQQQFGRRPLDHVAPGPEGRRHPRLSSSPADVHMTATLLAPRAATTQGSCGEVPSQNPRIGFPDPSISPESQSLDPRITRLSDESSGRVRLALQIP
ncbi:hypothetical protein PF003_g5265 [Phytophthora fragariae]|nr:hypothetical protein PF003_g5265 [Phytophthora fragariae]